MSSVKKIDARSGSAAHNGLNIFSVPPTNISIHRSAFREILPLSTIESDGPLEFRIFSDNLWIDLSEVYLNVELSLQKKHNNQWVNIEAGDTNVGSIQTMGQSFIGTLKMEVNGTEVYSENYYPYMCYIKNILSLSDDVKRDIYSAAGYYKDLKHDSVTDTGFLKRVSLFKEGRVAEFYSKLEFDLANQDKFMLNNTDIKFTIYKADDKFLVHTLKAQDTNEYRFKLHNAKLFVKTVDAQPSVNVGILRVLETKTANYANRRIVTRHTFITAGRSDLTYNAFSSVIPRRIIAGLVDHEAFSGHVAKTPFNFQPFGIRELTVEAGGFNFPSVRYDMHFTNDSIVRPFAEMHQALNLTSQNLSNGINLDMFRDGWTLFVIPLNSTLDETGGYELVRNGTTTIKLAFNTPLAKAATLVVVGEFDQLISIDNNRVVASDGSIV